MQPRDMLPMSFIPPIKDFQVVNVVLTNQDEEYMWPVPVDCVWIVMQARTATDIRMATRRGKVGTATPQMPYYTIKSGAYLPVSFLYNEDPDKKLYFACGTSGTVVEIIVGLSQQEE